MRKKVVKDKNRIKISGKSQALKDFFRKASFILPAMFMLVMLTGYPLFQVIQMSFFDYSDLKQPVYSGMSNYISVLSDPLFWNAMKNTLVFSIISVACGLCMGLILALLLNQPINLKVRAFFRSILMFPWLISSTVIAATWILILTPFGLFNGILKFFGFYELSQMAWLGDERTAIFGVIAANIWRGFPFMMLMILAGLQTIPKDLYEASDIDGANFFGRLLHITLPQLKNIILTITILELIWNFRAFDLVFLMTGGGPMNATENLSTFIYNHAFRRLDFGYASSAAISMLFVMILASWAYLKANAWKGAD